MIKFGDKHRGHTIEGRTTFLMNGGQHHQRIKLLYHHLRTAMCQTVHRSEYHTKAVEQRYTDTEFIVLRKAHVLTSEIAIISDVIVCQHHTLGEASRTRGILHVADIVTSHILLHRV